MKKVKIILILFTFILIFTGCENGNDTYFKDLSYNSLEEKLNGNEKFFFVVTQDGCSHCEDFIPIVKEVLKEYKITGYNFNLTKLSKADTEKFDKKFEVDGTPTTIFVKDGQEVSLLQRINGEADEERIIQKLKNNDYIK